MKTFVRFAPAALALTALAFATPSFAALKVGDKAPDFNLQAATNGKVSTFSLKSALKKGPVVVYFYPKAFTTGCSLEAHEFSEAMPQFEAKHVSVIGVSADDIDTLKKFSAQTCEGKFPVASDTSATVAKAYDAKIPAVSMASRVSYIVGQDDKIIFVHSDMNAATHVKSLLAAIQ
ncbi:peroxiredoxin [Asticcacaulis sp. EMRT-3]|uniref:peroxiredoxin n=1 Tax=Asticcacaulis sp. EMRT-3 TaxID=3040349 RepID=UPI0024AFEEAB|nr:peroxiredoxin [Asticcacaulis sp. EMRT-3]MDI7774586.1 peroxiredoxin [Asticcacaulis sp. EMRT-3]